MKQELVVAGIGIIGLAVAPTPDDVTVISPLAQLLVGGVLLGLGLTLKK